MHMTMTPIHRIPQSDEFTLQRVANEEIENFGIPISLRDTLMELIDPEDPNPEEHYSIVMDWAMQLRMELGIDWVNCIRVASVLYFG